MVVEDQITDNMEVDDDFILMRPVDVNEAGSHFNVDRPRDDHQDTLNAVSINPDPLENDVDHLHYMTTHSYKGSSQLTYLVKHWEYKQANAICLLREELYHMNKQRQQAEIKKLEILEEHRFDQQPIGIEKHHPFPACVLEKLYQFDKVVPPTKRNDNNYDLHTSDNKQEDDDGHLVADHTDENTMVYWKQRAMVLEKILQESRHREAVLLDKLEESIKNKEEQSTPVEELSHMLKRADNFIHFILQNAPIVLGHMDKELRYRFIYNHFPSFNEEDVIGKTDTEIFSGAGVKESLDFKREVLERGLPGKREVTFDTELFGSKTFLIYVEPVFDKAGETIGVNYIGMDITDQVRKREKMAKLREEIAVQKAMETELNKTIHVTEETMRAKQMLATVSHEIRSPLSGVVGMAEILSTTKLDKEQRYSLDVMISSGDLILQLINDILDLSKFESGVMRLEATKFRPREVVKHVLQTAAASSRKMLILEGNIADEVPIEVVSDVLRIRQILTNLVSNAIKFTHQGKVGIDLSVLPAPYSEDGDQTSEKTHFGSEVKGESGQRYAKVPYGGLESLDEPTTPVRGGEQMCNDVDRHDVTTVWIQCDVHDTGIGIPEHALPYLFEKYTQANADHARKYGGTGLGLAICKQLVEVMGGHMTVSSKENCGSTFTFVLPYRVPPICGDDEQSDDSVELPNVDHDAATDDITVGHFQFQPGRIGPLFTPIVPGVCRNQLQDTNTNTNNTDPALEENVHSLPPVVNAISNVNVDPTSTSQVTQPKRPPKILLVDDDKINVMITTSMVKQLGYTVDVVNNGVEAIHKVQTHRYDLILMDVYMAVMDGLQATRIIRSYEGTGTWDAAAEAGIIKQSPLDSPMNNNPYHGSNKKPIPIIAMTANSSSERAKECYASGMNSFVSKPVKSQTLKECLEQFLP